jgi:hypothetical protein
MFEGSKTKKSFLTKRKSDKGSVANTYLFPQSDWLQVQRKEGIKENHPSIATP